MLVCKSLQFGVAAQMVKDFVFIGVLREDTESLLLVPYRAGHAKDPQDSTGVPWELWTCFGNISN